MWNLVLLYLEIVLVSVQDMYMVVLNILWAQKLFWTHPIVLLGDESQEDADSVHLI
jgi:hypothetical protein